MKRIWIFSLIIVFIVLCDQFSKGIIQSHFTYGEVWPVIPGFFNLSYVKNSGAAFGMGAEANIYFRKFFFLIVPVLACFWLVILIIKLRHKSYLQGLAYSMILAGAIGNLIDRFSYGYVVDFLDFYFRDIHFWTFNIADSSITIAAFLLIIDYFITLPKNITTT